MLANGSTLDYKGKGASSYSNLSKLKEIPEIGDEPEKVDNTCLADTTKKYEYGIGDPGELEFKFVYDNSAANSSYRILRKIGESKEIFSFKLTLPDGTYFEWEAQVSVKLGGGGVNGAIEFTCKMALQSKISVNDPS